MLKTSFSSALRATALLSLVAAGAPAALAERPTALIQNDRLLTSDGGTLRGAPVFFDNWNHRDFAANRELYEAEFRAVVNDYGMNVVRICPYMGTYGINLKTNSTLRAEYMDFILTYVKWAEKYGVYAMINCHNQSGGWGEQAVRDFWEVVLDPANNADGLDFTTKSHVMFELTNEPDPQASKGDWQGIYDLVRAKAPDSILIVGSLVGPDKDGYAPQDLDRLDVDWSKTAYGFHCYEGAFEPQGSVPNPKVWTQQARAFMDFESPRNPEGFPVVCTELVSLTRANDLPIDFSILGHTVEQAEDAGIGWVTWAPRFQYRSIGNPTDSFNIQHEQIDFDLNFKQTMEARGLSVEAFRAESGNADYAEDGAIDTPLRMADGKDGRQVEDTPEPPSDDVAYPIDFAADGVTHVLGATVYPGFGLGSFDTYVFGTETRRRDQFRVTTVDFGDNGFNAIGLRYATDASHVRARVWSQPKGNPTARWTYLGDIVGGRTGGWNDFATAGTRLGSHVTGEQHVIFRCMGGAANISDIRFDRR